MWATRSRYPAQRTFSPLYPSYRSAFADLLGVRFIATGRAGRDASTPRSSPAISISSARTKDAYVYENPRALPRVMLMTDWQLADFEEVARSGWPAVGSAPHRAARAARRSGFSRAAAAGTPGTARLLRYANTEIVVEVDAPAGGILLLNDVWHPWWRATVDGADTEIMKANVIFRAVVVPRGRHTVRFTFIRSRAAEISGSDARAAGP